jgi:N-acetylglutamate synthase-like GNAT family acetyltransferase
MEQASDTVKEEVSIRKAAPEDLSAIEELIQQFVQDGKLLRRTFRELEDLMDTFFIAEYQGKLVGCAALDIYNQKLAEIRSLAVSPTVQGKGVGKLLVQACVNLAMEREIFEIMAISSSENFFRACGFDYTLPHERKAFFLQTRDDL